MNLALCKDAADEIERLRERLAKPHETAPNVLSELGLNGI
jgi:hypothetical protein